MTAHLKEVETKRDLRQFIAYPLKLYKNSPYYVPSLFTDEVNTLASEKNPAFHYSKARYWLAYRDGKLVGRIAGIINSKHNRVWNKPYIRFGWMEFIDDLEVSAAVLGTVEDWGRANGLGAIHGPLGFTDQDREGLLIEGFEEVATMATLFNYPYYADHMEKLGYTKDKDWVEFELIMPDQLDERILKASDIGLKRNNLHLLEARNKHDILPYATELFELVNTEYKALYGFSPHTPKEIQRYTEAYFGYVHPDFVPIILDEEGHMVAFGVAFPSLSKALQKSRGKLFPFGWARVLWSLNHNDRADLLLIAVKSSYRGLGINMVLIKTVWEAFSWV